MGKITGFLEIEREDRDYAPVEERVQNYREFVLPLPEKRDARPGCALHGLRRSRIVTTAVRSTTRSRTGTTLSITATGKRPRAICTRPTISRNSPAASARRRARRPARSTSTTSRSPSRPSNARLPTRRSRAAGSSRSRRRTRPARRSPSSARARLAWPARSSSRAPATTFMSTKNAGGWRGRCPVREATVRARVDHSSSHDGSGRRPAAAPTWVSPRRPPLKSFRRDLAPNSVPRRSFKARRARS